jgi:transcriptional repressor NrdR
MASVQSQQITGSGLETHVPGPLLHLRRQRATKVRSALFGCNRISLKMKCPYCGFGQDRVVDSRESKEADSIRRRRECERCNRRFTTYERIDEIPYMVVKKDGRRERFDRQKVLSGLLRACEKRPVSSSQLEQIVDATESYLVDAPERERTTSELGELIMKHLKGLDTVAYIRFASVYRDFKDVREFKEELEGLLEGRRGSKAKR